MCVCSVERCAVLCVSCLVWLRLGLGLLCLQPFCLALCLFALRFAFMPCTWPFDRALCFFALPFVLVICLAFCSVFCLVYYLSLPCLLSCLDLTWLGLAWLSFALLGLTSIVFFLLSSLVFIQSPGMSSAYSYTYNLKLK